MTLRIDIVTGFPEMLKTVLNQSMIKKGRDNKSVEIFLHDLRDFTEDKHQTIDDYPYGGGPGMVLKIEPFIRCLEKINSDVKLKDAEIILMSPRGERFSQEKAVQLCTRSNIIFLCGHYKGIDERIFEYCSVKELSIGDYVLSSGEISALVVTDAIVRLLPGVLKDIDSAWSDSFTDNLLDAPYYTRPPEYKGLKVPDVLLTGDHKKIDQWRQEQKMDATKKNRPDLYKKYLKSLK
jgi:tRNA (guanine37-N1)-methyltransferase